MNRRSFLAAICAGLFAPHAVVAAAQSGRPNITIRATGRHYAQIYVVDLVKQSVRVIVADGVR